MASCAGCVRRTALSRRSFKEKGRTAQTRMTTFPQFCTLSWSCGMQTTSTMQMRQLSSTSSCQDPCWHAEKILQEGASWTRHVSLFSSPTWAVLTRGRPLWSASQTNPVKQTPVFEEEIWNHTRPDASWILPQARKHGWTLLSSHRFWKIGIRSHRGRTRKCCWCAIKWVPSLRKISQTSRLRFWWWTQLLTHLLLLPSSIIPSTCRPRWGQSEILFCCCVLRIFLATWHGAVQHVRCMRTETVRADAHQIRLEHPNRPVSLICTQFAWCSGYVPIGRILLWTSFGLGCSMYFCFWFFDVARVQRGTCSVVAVVDSNFKFCGMASFNSMVVWEIELGKSFLEYFCSLQPLFWKCSVKIFQNTLKKTCPGASIFLKKTSWSSKEEAKRKEEKCQYESDSDEWLDHICAAFSNFVWQHQKKGHAQIGRTDPLRGNIAQEVGCSTSWWVDLLYHYIFLCFICSHLHLNLDLNWKDVRIISDSGNSEVFILHCSCSSQKLLEQCTWHIQEEQMSTITAREKWSY